MDQKIFVAEIGGRNFIDADFLKNNFGTPLPKKMIAHENLKDLELSG